MRLSPYDRPTPYGLTAAFGSLVGVLVSSVALHLVQHSVIVLLVAGIITVLLFVWWMPRYIRIIDQPERITAVQMFVGFSHGCAMMILGFSLVLKYDDLLPLSVFIPLVAVPIILFLICRRKGWYRQLVVFSIAYALLAVFALFFPV